MREYSLRIRCDNHLFGRLNYIMPKADVRSKNYGYWEWKIVEDNVKSPLMELMDFLIQHGSRLFDLGIKREDMSIWILYEYDEQCNFEFSPEAINKLALSGLPLCISCWQK